jgi:hypothetical protein
LHEGQDEGPGDGFWIPIPRPKKNAERVFDMAKAFLDDIQTCGYPVTNFKPDWMEPDPRLPGLWWTTGAPRGEGYNLGHYAGLFGIGFGTSAPAVRPLNMRVDGLTHGTLATIRVWEQTV